jgi:FtsZ-interacting cell division protein ZipA
MNVWEFIPHLDWHLACAIGSAVVAILLACLIYRKTFHKKRLKQKKGKSQKRRTEEKKAKSAPTTVASSAVSSSELLPESAEKHLVSSVTQPKKKHKPSPNSHPTEPVSAQLSDEAPDQQEDGDWITVHKSKKEQSQSAEGPGTSEGRSTLFPKPQLKLGKKEGRSKKESKSSAPNLQLESFVEASKRRDTAVVATNVGSDEDTEEEWREVRFTRKNRQYKNKD